MTESITIAMVQDNYRVGDISANADSIIRRAVEARAGGADLAVFPELALCGYPPEDLLYRPGFNRQINAAIAHIEQSVKGIDVLFGTPLLSSTAHGSRLHNAACWLRDGQRLACYFKQCLPNYSVFDEVRYFTPGESACVVTCRGHRIGVIICEDAWDPSPLRAVHAQGADIAVVLNASPYHVGKYGERVHVLRRRCTENSLPLLYVNMVGGQDELVFDGESMVLDAGGEVIARAPAFEADTTYVHCRPNGQPHANAPMPAPLKKHDAIYRALVLGVHDFVTKNGFKGVVIGLSGGIDSALTLAIAVDALGADNVQAVMMPSRYTADMSVEDAANEARLLGVNYEVIAIEPMFRSFIEALSPMFAGYPVDTTEENIQARIRGVLLMAISNKTGRMVLTTGNKSEMAVGYATLYGDMSGGFAPLKDVSKMLVYELARYRNGCSPVIPERVITRAPSAELRADQTDQDSLPDYDVLDRILELSVEQDLPVDDIVATGIDRSTAERVIGMVQRNEYKRRQSAPGVRITRRAFGRDRRYPITSGYTAD